MNIRAIIIAGGQATRWKNHLDTPKHLVEVDGQPILHRTANLLRDNGVEDIHVVAREEYREECTKMGVNLFIPEFNTDNADADKFLNSQELWNEKGKTLVIYGDVYFTEDAIRQIAHHRHEDWLLFARPFASRLTGKGCGECFAQTFYPNHHSEHLQALKLLVYYFKSGRLGRIGGWEHYRIMNGMTEDIIHRQMIGDRFVEINDWTEDFDTQADYERFMTRYDQAKEIKMSLADYGRYSCDVCSNTEGLAYRKIGVSHSGEVPLFKFLCNKCRKRINS